MRRTYPTAVIRYHRACRLGGTFARWQHAQRPHDIENTPGAGANTQLVKAQRLPGFIQQQRYAAVRCRLADRTVAQFRIQHDGHTKLHGQSQSMLIAQIGATLRQIASLTRPRLKVTSMSAVTQYDRAYAV